MAMNLTSTIVIFIVLSEKKEGYFELKNEFESKALNNTQLHSSESYIDGYHTINLQFFKKDNEFDVIKNIKKILYDFYQKTDDETYDFYDIKMCFYMPNGVKIKDKDVGFHKRGIQSWITHAGNNSDNSSKNKIELDDLVKIQQNNPNASGLELVNIIKQACGHKLSIKESLDLNEMSKRAIDEDIQNEDINLPRM